MEQKESPTQKIPIIDERTRVEVYRNLQTNITDVLKRKSFVSELFNWGSEDNEKVLIRDIEVGHARYRFIRNLAKDFAELQIQRNGKRYDNPNIALEEIRLKIGRPGVSLAVPDFEYHRTLKEGGSKTLTNNVLALRNIEKFIGEMKTNLQA